MPELIKSKIKLTIGMLVSNHIETIRNCMESLQPLLRAVPSELVVLDTKGAETDGSIAVVREYTDRIYPFVWCNDFSAARNACLAHAKGEWFLYLDDDEWFDSVQEFIDFFQSGECENYYSGFYYTRDYAADGSYSTGIAGRMIRRTVTTRFVGRVHEGFAEVFAPNKRFSCFTHHYGYAFADEASKKKHQQRNLSILEEERRQHGDTPRICAQMVQELLYLPETRKQGNEFCLASIDRLEQQGQLTDSCSQWVLLASVRYYQSIGAYEKAVERVREVERRYPVNRMTRLCLAAVAVSCAASCGEYLTIRQQVPVYLECRSWLREHPEVALLMTQMDMPKYDTERYLEQMLQAGAVVENAMQEYEKAYEYWRQLPWNSEGSRGSRYQEQLLETLRGLPQKQPLLDYYRSFYQACWFTKENRGILPKECQKALEETEAGGMA